MEMMGRQRGSIGNSINGLLIFLVYSMFALFSLFLVVIGAQVYREVVDTAKEAASVRAAFSYVSNKVRMASGEIRLDESGDFPVLKLAGDGELDGYETRIYYYDGALREAFTASGEALSPQMGEEIVELLEFTMERTGEGQLLISMRDREGRHRRLHLDKIRGYGYE